jgi:hypothetical protein
MGDAAEEVDRAEEGTISDDQLIPPDMSFKAYSGQKVRSPLPEPGWN